MMTGLFAFMGEHPILTVLWMPVVCVALWCATSVARAPFEFAFRAFNRRLRSKNIIARGWPPTHLDADGDVVQLKPQVRQ